MASRSECLAPPWLERRKRAIGVKEAARELQRLPLATTCRNTVHFGAQTHDFVIPAKAGIQAAHPSSGYIQGPLDSRLRGNDD